MFERVGRLFASEMARVWRTKLPYLGLAASALMAVVAWQFVQSGQADETVGSYLIVCINFSTTLIIPIFAVIFSSILVAGEASRGTLRTLLTRPISRGDFLTAKWLVALSYLFLLILANLIPALIIGQQYPLVGKSDRAVDIPGLAAHFQIFGTGVLLTLLPLIATVAFGFMVSTLTTNVSTAIGGAIGTLLTMQTAKEFVRFGEFKLSPWVFSSYYDTAMGITGDKIIGSYSTWANDKVYMLVGTSLASTVVFIILSYRVFLRRDMNF
ncbi:MAG: ABC transporter permease [Candidatus Sumerlaeaceae bacterium]|nr:ABC transporter permease [Candidatus Sumerlaeaceae bacterium]